MASCGRTANRVDSSNTYRQLKQTQLVYEKELLDDASRPRFVLR